MCVLVLVCADMVGWGKGCRTGATGVSFGAHIIAHANRFDMHMNPQDCRV